MLPEMDDDKGTSLILVHTSKGEKLFNEITSQISYQKVELEKAIQYNPSAINSVKLSSKRNGFMRDIDIINFNQAVNKYCKDSILIKSKQSIYQILSKVKKIMFRRKY